MKRKKKKKIWDKKKKDKNECSLKKTFYNMSLDITFGAPNSQ